MEVLMEWKESDWIGFRNNQPLIPGFGDNGTEGQVKFSICFRKVFDVDFVVGSGVKQDAGDFSDESSKESLEQ